MTRLNQAQKRAVEYTDGPLLIVAGAGTGKTTVITQKISYLVENGLAKPEEILALTFTEKAAGEMEERVDRLLNTAYTQIQISTFHKFCQQLLEDFGLDIGLPNRFKLLTETDAWLLVRENLDKFDLDYYRPMGNPVRHIHELLRHFSKCKDELIAPEDYLRHAENIKLDGDDVNTDGSSRLEEIANAYHVYNQLLLDNGVLDFGDLIFYSVKLLDERPRILTRLKKQFKYILVDEFQDVNYAQYVLTRHLTNSLGDTEAPRLTVVGDDDQSIYAFRGASVSNILQFKNDFPNAYEVVLTENYRSDQKILDHAYKLIQHNNPDRLEVKLKIDKRLRSKMNGYAGAICQIHTSSVKEVDFVVGAIKKLSEQGNCTYDDFAILVRANNHALPFMEALERAGIPYEFLTSKGLHRQEIAVDCFNIFKALDNYYDDYAIYELLCLPHWKFEANDLVKFTKSVRQKSRSFYDALAKARAFRVSDEFASTCEKLKNLIDTGANRSRFEKPTTILLEFLQDSGYLEWLTIEEEQDNRNILRDIRHLKQFFEFIERYQETMPKSRLAGFVHYYSQVLNSGDEGSLYQPTDTPDSVNILTVHSAKGLEFKYVFIVNCVEERFPSRIRSEAIEIPIGLIKQELPEGNYHEQEERRLFYVAMTRAKETLYLTGADYYEGNKRKKKLSRFIEECGIKSKEITDNKKVAFYSLQTTLHDQIVTAERQTLSTEVQFVIPNKFSFSQIRAFQTCKFQYKLAYLLQIPTKQSHYFSFGNTMHVTLQRFYERVQDMNGAVQSSLFDSVTSASDSKVINAPTLDELLELYDMNWIEDWYQSKRQREEYYAKGKEILKEFYKRHDKQWSVPVVIEKGFKMKIGEYVVTGKIDRIDMNDEKKLHIIDYKTGKAKEKTTGSDKEQLLLYQLAAMRTPYFRNLGHVRNLTYYYLNEGMVSSFLGTEKELLRFEAKVQNTIDEIYATPWGSIGRSQGCGRCEYCSLSAK